MRIVTQPINMTVLRRGLVLLCALQPFLCLQTVAKRKQKGNRSEEVVLSCKTQLEQLARDSQDRRAPGGSGGTHCRGRSCSQAPRECTLAALDLSCL